ncbi:MAG TPA: permease-like cell division protein FtsX [Patescibacteria group bacterium]|nr:permease-like cell division protein FtsX [Patescibacteria group bacterium]
MKAWKTSWKHIRRTPYQALAAICIMMLTFLAISVFAMIVFGSSVILQYFESRPQVTSFFKSEAQQHEIDTLKAELQKTGLVAEMTFVTKEQAFARYKEQNKDDPLLLELVSADILPPSLEVSTAKIEDLATIAQIMRGSPAVLEGEEGVVYQQDVIELLSLWTNGIRIVGIVIIVILAVVSIIIMMTIIGFKVSQKREEIEIMKLLSATNWYIRWPFVFEGIFYGVVGTFIGWLIASAALLFASPYLALFLKGIPLLPVSPLFLLALLGGELIIAIGLGVISSSLAVLRYLK